MPSRVFRRRNRSNFLMGQLKSRAVTRRRFRKGRGGISIALKKRTATTPLLMLKAPQIVPDRIRLKLTYAEISFVMDTTAGTYTEWFFKGNSVFDPDSTGVGHQPLGYDQWAAFYNRYRVYGSTITCKITVSGTLNATSQSNWCLYPTQAAAGSSTMAQAIEQPYSKWIVSSNGVNVNPTLRNRAGTAKFLGYENVEDSDDLSALVTADPAHLWYWSISTAAVDATAALDAFVNVKLVYDVEFFDRKNLALS